MFHVNNSVLDVLHAVLCNSERAVDTRNVTATSLFQHTVSHVLPCSLAKPQNHIRPMPQSPRRNGFNKPFSSRRRAVNLANKQDPDGELGRYSVELSHLT